MYGNNLEQIKKLHMIFPEWAYLPFGIFLILLLGLTVVLFGIGIYLTIFRGKKDVSVLEKTADNIIVFWGCSFFISMALFFLTLLFTTVGFLAGFCYLLFGGSFSVFAFITFITIMNKVMGQKFQWKRFLLWLFISAISLYFLTLSIGFFNLR